MANIKPEFKAKWVPALRSGKYHQTRGSLKDEIGYCCLGVACELAQIPLERQLDGSFIARGFIFPHSNGWVEPMEKLFGLTIDDALILSQMNDDGKSFSEIADYIEEYL